MAPLLIYGATGYTGRMASEQAKNIGLDFTIAGRTEPKLKDLACRLDAPYHEPPNGMKHYLDISAEVESFRQAEQYDKAAQEAGIMLLPGCGGSVVMLGCLASHVTNQVKHPKTIDISLHVAVPMSRGSAISASNMTTGCLQLLEGRLVEQDVTKTAEFDFDDGNGTVTSFPVTLPDLLTIPKSSNVAIIRVYAYASGNSFPTGNIELLPDGPMAAERHAAPYPPYQAVAIVTSEEGITRCAALHTLNGYTFMCLASVEGARRFLNGETQQGFSKARAGAGFWK